MDYFNWLRKPICNLNENISYMNCNYNVLRNIIDDVERKNLKGELYGK